MTTKSTTNHMNVANIAQKIAFLFEMQGQISDGMWENARPFEHWKPWSDLSWETVSVNPENIGKDFSAPKDNYNINNMELLEIVSERLINEIKFYLKFPEQAEKLYSQHIFFEDVDAFDRYMKAKSDSDKERKSLIESVEVTRKMVQEAIESPIYDMKKLRIDLAGLRKAMGTKMGTDIVTTKEKTGKRGSKSTEKVAKVESKKEVPVTATVKDAAPVAVDTGHRLTNKGDICWNGNGWYQYDRRNRSWNRIETIDHTNTNPIGYFADADLIAF